MYILHTAVSGCNLQWFQKNWLQRCKTWKQGGVIAKPKEVARQAAGRTYYALQPSYDLSRNSDALDDCAKDVGYQGLTFCSFYHESLHTWIETIVNKFAVSNHTVLTSGVHALRSCLKLICEYELHSLPYKRVSGAKDHGKTLVRHLLRNCSTSCKGKLHRVKLALIFTTSNRPNKKENLIIDIKMRQKAYSMGGATLWKRGEKWFLCLRLFSDSFIDINEQALRRWSWFLIKAQIERRSC